jgi:hypothetical protein
MTATIWISTDYLSLALPRISPLEREWVWLVLSPWLEYLPKVEHLINNKDHWCSLEKRFYHRRPTLSISDL